MAQFFKTVEVPARPAKVEQRLDRTECDLCGDEIPADRGSDEPGEVDEVKVIRDVGVCWPECTHGERTIFDVCGKCFETKLVPWMKEQGATPRVEDYNYD